MGKMRNAYKNLAREPEGKRPLMRTEVNTRIILKWILKK
jgi:hypothetical protein